MIVDVIHYFTSQTQKDEIDPATLVGQKMDFLTYYIFTFDKKYKQYVIF